MTENEAKDFLGRFSLYRIEYANGKEIDNKRFNYFTEVLVTAMKALEEIQQYRAIGTVEECQEAMERQRAKKPYLYGGVRRGLDNAGNSISKEENCYECPTCDQFLGYEIDCKGENYQVDYCHYCGQSLLWERDDE